MFNIFLHNDTYYEYFIENAKVFTKNLITIYFFIIMVCALVVSSLVFVVCVYRM